MKLQSKKEFEVNLDNLNGRFFKWLKKILKFDISRTLQLNTFLINFYIAQNYFHRLEELYRMLPQLLPESFKVEDIKPFRVNYERIFSIFVLMVLKFNWKKKLSAVQTTQQIDKLHAYGPLMMKFFTLNFLPSNLSTTDLNLLMNQLQKSIIVENLLPHLEFDPLFQEVLKNNAIRHIFFTSAPRNLLNVNIKQATEEIKYVPERNFFLESLKARKDLTKSLFKINSELGISKFLLNYFNYNGIYDFGNFTLINELIDSFTNYYSIRVPSKEEELKNYLLCFGELFKLAEGKLYQEINYRTVVERLETKVSQDSTLNFLDKFCYETENQEFKIEFIDFDPYQFLQDYHDFLMYAGYVHYGIIRTGAYLIWRALIKYLESLQEEDEFKSLKGKLLESWAYEKAVEYGFDPFKLILINPKKSPTPRYKDMREEIESFPGESVEIEAEFPNNDKSYYHEIDLVFKIKENLFLFECKGTRARIGEEGRYFSWSLNFIEQINHLGHKSEILYKNIRSKFITHPYLEGIEYHTIQVIKTEGIYSQWGELTIQEYVQDLKNLRENLGKGTIDAYLKERTRFIK